MNIEELQDAKAKAESDISVILINLESATECRVKKVKIEHVEFAGDYFVDNVLIKLVV